MQNITHFGTIRSESDLRNLLESLSLTDNIGLLHTIFSSLGYQILLNHQHSNLVIQFKPLYDKILLVLNQGPLTKTKLTLNLISALLLAETRSNHSRKGALRMYAQNMIRISGCLSALCYLFTNSMLQHETWTALCQSLSEACYKSVLNQNYCAHLVPLCIQRCRRSNTDVLLVLHSLLVNHDRNIKVFYESDGMTIFSRDNLLYTPYLRTLNTVIENTRPSHREHIESSNDIFQRLKRWVLTDDSGSAVTKWAGIVLYSRLKLLGADAKLNEEDMDFEDDGVNSENDHDGMQDKADLGATKFQDKRSFETQDLLRNVMREVHDWRVQGKTRTPRDIGVGSKINATNNLNHLLKYNQRNEANRFHKLGNTAFKRNSIFQKDMNKAARDLSFSFLLNENHRDNTRWFRSGTYTVKDRNQSSRLELRERYRQLNQRSKRSRVLLESHRENKLDTRRIKETPSKNTFCRTTCTLHEYDHNITDVYFRPQRASTPKQSPFDETMRPASRHISVKDVTFKRHSPKCVKNLSMTSKFMDIINGSCTTLVRGISRIKNVFAPKTAAKDQEETIDVKDTVKSGKLVQQDCNYSFTNYMRNRDEVNHKPRNISRGESTFYSEAPSSCYTCNNTIVLKQKLMKHQSLKECVKKLKLGINLYGCDFKKIARLLWPREPYMTPEVLYTLYRKLIAK